MAEQRLPVVDGDDGVWGEVLNQYISKEHYNSGTNNPDNGGHKNITIRPGTTSAGTAPLKFISGSLMSVAEVGAVEYNNGKYYFTDNTPVRKTVAIYDDSSGAEGDLYYRDSSGNFIRKAIGSSGQIMTVSGGLPSWNTVLDGTAKITVGTTAPSSPNVGDIWIDTN